MDRERYGASIPEQKDNSHISRTKDNSLPESDCNVRILRKRSSPYDAWLTDFELDEVNCQIFPLTPPVPRRAEPEPEPEPTATTTFRTITMSKVKVNAGRIQITAPKGEARFFYLSPFVPFRSYVPPVRYQNIPYISSLVPFYQPGYFFPLRRGPQSYNLLPNGSSLKAVSSEESRRKREAPSLPEETNMKLEPKKRCITNLLSLREGIAEHKTAGELAPARQRINKPASLDAIDRRLYSLRALLGNWTRLRRK
uniref:Uncharacterized protein LOC117367600 n=1 Tax=Geotrypetes seraphini TaxID=260995 RepID=A0A6P8SC40_GEOSA|nr:uncharacterized protein LOC117367600 [Geotrypetes seraphini]